jgi:glutamine synthetase
MTSYLRQHVHPNIEYSDMIWIPTLATISQVPEPEGSFNGVLCQLIAQ